MLDYYDIKLPSVISNYIYNLYYRTDILRREAERFDYLCELYRYEMEGGDRHPKYTAIPCNLKTILHKLGEHYDISKYQRYLDYLGLT